MTLDIALDPFVSAALETLSVMAGLPPAEVTSGLVRGVAPVHEISAVIGFGGGSRQGALVLSTDRATASRLVARLGGEDEGTTPGEEELADGLAELANIVAGAALSALGGELGLGLPTVVAGSGHRVFRARAVENHLAFLATSVGSLCLQVHRRGGGEAGGGPA